MSAFDGTSWILEDGPPLVQGVDVVLFFADGTLSGTAGCNRFHGRYELRDEMVGDGEASATLSVGPLATTMKACPPDVMALERDVLQRLERATSISTINDMMVLAADGSMVLMLSRQTVHGLTGIWEVAAVHWPDRQAIISVTPPADGAALTVNLDGERISGHGGCNTFNGRLLVGDDGSVRVGPMVSTMRMCEPPEIMDQEQALFRALESTAGFRLEGSQLTLLRADGGIAVSLHRA